MIPIVDLHDAESFKEAKEYFKELLETYKKNDEKPKIFLFYHKYDLEDFEKKLLDTNVSKAKESFENIFQNYEFQSYLTSIYEQDHLGKVFREILISSFEEIKGHLEKAEKQLEEIKAKIIVSDISGNIIVHNVEGVSRGLALRVDLRDFINSCNTVRENIFMSDSATFKGCNENNKELELYIFKYIIAVLIMKSEKLDSESQDKINILLNDMELFAELIISSHID